jgi:hypothetical protein
LKNLQPSDQAAISNRDKEPIGLGSRALRAAAQGVYFHASAARLLGAIEDDVTEPALIAEQTLQFDYDEFVRKFDQIPAHVREHMGAGVRSAEPGAPPRQARAVQLAAPLAWWRQCRSCLEAQGTSGV